MYAGATFRHSRLIDLHDVSLTSPHVSLSSRYINSGNLVFVLLSHRDVVLYKVTDNLHEAFLHLSKLVFCKPRHKT